MPHPKPSPILTLTIDKFVHGGQALATAPDGKKVFVWNALPGEVVEARLIKQKRSYAEAIAETIVQASPQRIEPREPNFLATSPWQIMPFALENEYKHEITLGLMEHEKVVLPEVGPTIHTTDEFHYRNKMEYSFWGDEAGLHLALHERGSHGKHVVVGSQLAMPSVDAGASAIVSQLTKLQTRAGDLKTIIVRSSQNGDTVAALYTKLPRFTALSLPPELKGLRVYHSDPRSPASVRTRLLQQAGDAQLHDELLGTSFTYDVDAFFQVNLPAFELALQTIKDYCGEASLLDLYAGVGTIGLSVARERVNLIELDAATAAMARLNAEASQLEANVIEASTEKVMEYVSGAEPVIVDPPRAGLHHKLVNRLIEHKPSKVIYLSCNPATQARDLALLQQAYRVVHFSVYNFFPRTPHIESLAVLEAKI